MISPGRLGGGHGDTPGTGNRLGTERTHAGVWRQFKFSTLHSSPLSSAQRSTSSTAAAQIQRSHYTNWLAGDVAVSGQSPNRKIYKIITTYFSDIYLSIESNFCMIKL